MAAAADPKIFPAKYGLTIPGIVPNVFEIPIRKGAWWGAVGEVFLND